MFLNLLYNVGVDRYSIGTNFKINYGGIDTVLVPVYNIPVPYQLMCNL
jgi:hypothetical protein